MTSADFCVFSNTLQYWLLLSERITQTSPGTTRFLLSIHLPHLSCMIPCSYGALTCSAALPSCITSYVISVRQTRDLPMSSYIPHIQLPSDSTSRWTPLPSAISFPLPGGLGTCTLWKRAPPGAHVRKGAVNSRQSLFVYICNCQIELSLLVYRCRCFSTFSENSHLLSADF